MGVGGEEAKIKEGQERKGRRRRSASEKDREACRGWRYCWNFLRQAKKGVKRARGERKREREVAARCAAAKEREEEEAGRSRVGDERGRRRPGKSDGNKIYYRRKMMALRDKEGRRH